MNFTGKKETPAPAATKNTFEPITNYMAKNVITFSPEQSIYDAIDIMLEKRISGGPVLDKSGALIGILSEKDCLKVMVDAVYHNQLNTDGVVKDYMSTTVTTVDVSKDVVDVANMFLTSNFRRYPVVEQGKLKGQVSRRDVMKAAAKLRGTTW
ncbi:MAG: CBS domain-containing protein [Cyclobacteriaceae bacterium]